MRSRKVPSMCLVTGSPLSFYLLASLPAHWPGCPGVPGLTGHTLVAVADQQC